ncbi:MAG: hypothetical protein KDC48_18445 [Planctomycetes bacterium]|nr:hypothetical protein [Planctomycetota bacterium]
MRVTVGHELELKCQVCGHADFESRNVLMNTPGMTFMGLDWANQSAKCFLCTRCGFVHWFVFRKPQ